MKGEKDYCQRYPKASRLKENHIFLKLGNELLLQFSCSVTIDAGWNVKDSLDVTFIINENKEGKDSL